MNVDMIFTDKTLTCADCGQDFIFTEGEQKYFWSKGLSEPKRCKPCRMLRRRSMPRLAPTRLGAPVRFFLHRLFQAMLQLRTGRSLARKDSLLTPR